MQGGSVGELCGFDPAAGKEGSQAKSRGDLTLGPEKQQEKAHSFLLPCQIHGHASGIILSLDAGVSRLIRQVVGDLSVLSHHHRADARKSQLFLRKDPLQVFSFSHLFPSGTGDQVPLQIKDRDGAVQHLGHLFRHLDQRAVFGGGEGEFLLKVSVVVKGREYFI